MTTTLTPEQMADALPHVVTTAPARIYLVIGEDVEPETDFDDLDRGMDGADVTWCADKIDDNSIAYVRSDLAVAPHPAPQPQPAQPPEGWKLVPMKSTDSMHIAYTRAKYEGPQPVLIPDLWTAMLHAAPTPTAQADVREPTSSERLREAGYTPRDNRIECDECGKKFTVQFLPIHKCEPVSEPTEAQIEDGARALCKRHVEAWHVNEQHAWEMYRAQFRADAASVLRAALAAKE